MFGLIVTIWGILICSAANNKHPLPVGAQIYTWSPPEDQGHSEVFEFDCVGLGKAPKPCSFSLARSFADSMIFFEAFAHASAGLNSG